MRITSSPHIHSGESTRKIMLNVCLAMLPACIFGVYSFGPRALAVLLVSLASSLLFEFVFNRISKYDYFDGSALVTGLLIGMNMPSTIPLFIPVVASFFAIVVAKWTFGGLGANWANPAIAGRIFVFFSFSNVMSSFAAPRLLAGADAISSASPLSFVKTAVSSGEYLGLNSLEILANSNFPISSIAAKISSSTGINAYLIDSFLGNIPGCIGEVSSLLLLAGFIYLLAKKIVTWHIPVSLLSTFAILTWVFGGIPNGLGLFNGEVLPSIFRGGLLLGTFFMATDYVTTPITQKGHIIFGVGCGFLTFLFRTFGSLPEAISVAILMMNIATPTIDKFCKPKLFGETLKEAAK